MSNPEPCNLFITLEMVLLNSYLRFGLCSKEQIQKYFCDDAPELTEGLDDGVRVRMSLPRDLTSSSLSLIFGVMSLIQMTECLD